MSAYTYGTVDQEVITKLKAIVGDQYVVTDDEKMEPYSHDEVAEEEYAHMPDVVVKPKTAREISEIVKLANEKRIPVTPRGAGSGLSGGAVPLYGGILLSVERNVVNRSCSFSWWYVFTGFRACRNERLSVLVGSVYRFDLLRLGHCNLPQSTSGQFCSSPRRTGHYQKSRAPSGRLR